MAQIDPHTNSPLNAEQEARVREIVNEAWPSFMHRVSAEVINQAASMKFSPALKQSIDTPLRIKVRDLTDDEIAKIEADFATAGAEWRSIAPSEPSTGASLRNAIFASFSMSACLWLAIGAVVWAVFS